MRARGGTIIGAWCRNAPLFRTVACERARKEGGRFTRSPFDASTAWYPLFSFHYSHSDSSAWSHDSVPLWKTMSGCCASTYFHWSL